MKTENGLIALLGDVSLSGLFLKESERNMERFEAISPVLMRFPLVLANLEAPVWGDGEMNCEKADGRGVIHYTSAMVLEEVLPRLNIGAVSLANNHIYDCGKSGVVNTITCLEKLGVRFTGAGTEAEHLEPVFFDMANRRVGFAAYVDRDTNPLVPEDADIYVNYFDEAAVTAKIHEIKKNCDMLILSIHWGRDYSAYPTPAQRETALRLNDAGADIIMGHHAHMLQPYEPTSKGAIFYGLGSFCYGDFMHEGKRRALKRKTKKSMVAVVDPAANVLPGIPVRELRGNTVIPVKRKKSNRRRLRMMRLNHGSGFFRRLVTVKETAFDRVWEYFFGYYRNPLVQLFSIANIKKLKYIKRDAAARPPSANKKTGIQE